MVVDQPVFMRIDKQKSAAGGCVIGKHTSNKVATDTCTRAFLPVDCKHTWVQEAVKRSVMDFMRVGINIHCLLKSMDRKYALLMEPVFL